MSKRSRSKSRRLLPTSLLILLIIALVAFRLAEDIGPERTPGDRFVVVRVLDGDTIELAGGDIVRLLAVDTPEKDEPLYDEATRFLERLVLGKAVQIEYAGARRDRYGRLLGYVFVDTLLVNRAIITNGLGYLYLFDDTPIESPEIRSMLAAQQTAIDARVGLMGLPRQAEPIYLASPRGFRFHRPACRSLTSKEPGYYREFTSRVEALGEGLSPCRNCSP